MSSIKTLKFEYTDEFLQDMRAVHNIDIVNVIKDKLLELDKTWELFPNNETKHNMKLKFTMHPKWIVNEDGSESFSFDIKKEVLPL